MTKFAECFAALDVEIAAFELIMNEGWVGNAAPIFAALGDATKELHEARSKVERIAAESI